MSLIQLSFPLRSLARLIKALERIANACERAYPPIPAKLKEPTSGLTIVTNEMLLEEEERERLRLAGYMPDDIERMIEDASGEPSG